MKGIPLIRRVVASFGIVVVTLFMANFWVGKKKLVGEHYSLPENLKGTWHLEDLEKWGTSMTIEFVDPRTLIVSVSSEEESPIIPGKYQIDRMYWYFHAYDKLEAFLPNLFGEQSYKLFIADENFKSSDYFLGDKMTRIKFFDVKTSRYTKSINIEAVTGEYEILIGDFRPQS